MLEKIKKAKANTLVRVNNVIYAKVSDAENSSWRSAFGITYANAFINRVLQSENVEFLTNEPLKPTNYERKKRKSVKSNEEICENCLIEEKEPDVSEEERNEY